MEPWLAELRAAFDRAFEVDWPQHVQRLNESLQLTGTDTLSTSGRPPEFFWGDLGALVPGEWVAVISLNPQLPSAKDEAWYAEQEWTPQSYWDYLNRRDLRGFPEAAYYYARFARPLVKLAGAALGVVDPVEDEVAIVMRRMAFFDILPYASRMYVPRPETAVSLIASDPGCAFASQTARAAIEHRQPRVVLVNGKDAVNVFESVWGVAWVERRYPSVSREGKMLRHWEGVIESGERGIPVVGFPQLRAQNSHNSNAEVEQLASRVAELANPR